MKPTITFFGEKVTTGVTKALEADWGTVDLLIVMGTSLQVAPMSGIVGYLPQHVPQILINREPVAQKPSVSLGFDVELLGDCDVVVGELCRRLGQQRGAKRGRRSGAGGGSSEGCAGGDGGGGGGGENGGGAASWDLTDAQCGDAQCGDGGRGTGGGVRGGDNSGSGGGGGGSLSLEEILGGGSGGGGDPVVAATVTEDTSDSSVPRFRFAAPPS